MEEKRTEKEFEKKESIQVGYVEDRKIEPLWLIPLAMTGSMTIGGIANIVYNAGLVVIDVGQIVFGTVTATLFGLCAITSLIALFVGEKKKLPVYNYIEDKKQNK